MPIRNTTETRGSITDIDFTRANYRTYFIPAGHSYTICLSPNGYLCAILVQPDYSKRWGNDSGDIVCEVTDGSGQALFEQFVIQSAVRMTNGGCVFPEPLPNMDTRSPYYLAVCDPHPDLEVIVVGCYAKTS